MNDPKALRALAHPLRWKLLDFLGIQDEATATTCADALGESVASCSYHLNILAKYGFIEEAPAGRGRDKPWRLVSSRQSLSAEGLGVEGELAAEAATEVFLDHELGRLKARLRGAGREPKQWRDATGLTGVTTFLTHDELRSLTQELQELSQRYADRLDDRVQRPPDSREVRIFVATTVAPRPADQPPTDSPPDDSPPDDLPSTARPPADSPPDDLPLDDLPLDDHRRTR